MMYIFFFRENKNREFKDKGDFIKPGNIACAWLFKGFALGLG